MTIICIVNHSTSKLFNENWIGTVIDSTLKSGHRFTQIFTDKLGGSGFQPRLRLGWITLPAGIGSAFVVVPVLVIEKRRFEAQRETDRGRGGERVRIPKSEFL
jgi:hypothetical protein